VIEFRFKIASNVGDNERGPNERKTREYTVHIYMARRNKRKSEIKWTGRRSHERFRMTKGLETRKSSKSPARGGVKKKVRSLRALKRMPK